MKRLHEYLVSILVSSLIFIPLNLKADTSTLLQANEDIDSHKFQLCKASYSKAKDKGPDKIEAEQILSEEYKQDPEYLQKAWTSYRWNLVLRGAVSALTYGIPFSLAVAYYYKYVQKAIVDSNVNKKKSAPISTMNNLKFVGALIAGTSAWITNNYLLARVLGTPTEGLFSTLHGGIDYSLKYAHSILTNTPLPETWNVEVEIKAAQLQYENIKSALPLSYQIAVEDQFTKLHNQYIEPSTTRISLLPGKDEGTRKSVLQALRSIERIISIPQKVKKVEVHQEKLKELLSNYPETLQKKLTNFANGISYRSKQDASTQNFRQVLYLQGAPGTGKTWFAEHFADVFYELSEDKSISEGLPLIKISLEDVTDLRDLIGQPASRFDDMDRKPSKFSQALTNLAKNMRYKNAIIVLDEADKFLNSERAAEIRGYLTKEIFNLSTKKMKLHDLGVEVDISNYHFILIGNAPIFDASNAFMDRMTVLKFPAFDEEKRIRIACGEFGKGMSKLDEDISITDENFQLILEGVHKDQVQKPGVRSLLKTVEEYIEHLRNPENLKVKFPFSERLEANSQIYADPYSMYETTLQKFEREKDTLTLSLQKTITQHLDKITKSKLLNEALRPDNAESKKALEIYLQNIDAMMHFPDKVVNLTKNQDTILKNLHELLRLYPEDVRTPIEDLVKLHIAASENPSLNVSKNVVYFWGVPGSGKSYLAQGLAKVLGLSIIELDLKGGKYSEIFGETYFDFMDSPPSKFSLFTRTFLNLEGKNSDKNGVIYINEIDKVLNNPRGMQGEEIKTTLLDILDPDKKEFTLRELKASIDLTRYLFILVGNDKIKSSNAFYSALDDRMTLIEFKGFSLESKQEIAASYFEKLAKESALSIQDEHTTLVENLMAYSHNEKKQVSLRTPFKIIELYANWLKKPEGVFDYKTKLDLFSRDKDREVPPHHPMNEDLSHFPNFGRIEEEDTLYDDYSMEI